METVARETLARTPSTPPKEKSGNRSVLEEKRTIEDTEDKRSKSKLLSPYDPAHAGSSPADDRRRFSASGVKSGRIYVAGHAVPPQPPCHLRRGQGEDLALGNNEHGPTGQQTRDQLEEEVESMPSLLEDELPPPPP
ncbi:UNVERIFIED_CONTAM: hypothetical protein Sradi_7090900 [Sesamum radiatum]|uniref:Uncharacterized protein n=1 Tax=Sesamum radiatum TaxID=300843 RepID=A0AAW2J411_SESRA